MNNTCLIEELEFPEGPCFDSKGRLWCTELKAGNLVCYEYGKTNRFHVGDHINGAAVDSEDNIWFTDSARGHVGIFETDTHDSKIVCDQADGVPLSKPNDLAFDLDGNLIVSCHGDGRETPTGYLICIDLSNKAKIIAKNKFFTNGIAFSEEGNFFIYSETYNQSLWKAEWEPEACKIKSEEIWGVTEGPKGPDGICFDQDGFLYVAVFDQGVISIFDQEGGKSTTKINLPTQRPTSCAFDPWDRYGLIVTDAEKGRVLSIKSKNKGVPLFKRTYG